MKKGYRGCGIVDHVEFPNKGIVITEDGERVIVKNSIPGQKVEFAVNKIKHKKAEGRLMQVIEKSELETEKACPHFGACGGCTYQTVPYEKQLEMKLSQVKKLIVDAIGTEDEAGYKFLGIKGSPQNKEYRNKMEFSFGDEYKDGPLALGMHKRGSFYDIVTVKDCQIVDEDFRKILEAVLEFYQQQGAKYYHKLSHQGYLRHLLVRKAVKTEEILIDLVTTTQTEFCGGEETDQLTELSALLQSLNLKGKIAGILHTQNDSLADVVQNDHTDILSGQDYFFEELLGLKFRISPFSFFQTNSLGAEVLYDTARSYVGETKDKTIFDLYSGTGTIAQMLAPVAKHVIGIEIVEEAVEAAKENAKSNGLDNCTFIAGDVLKAIDLVEEKPDFIVLDPPRDGIHPKALEKIIHFGVEQMVYISCKPTSLARDLEILQAHGYVPEKVCCVDMFPGTVHVETVVLLSQQKADDYIEIDLDLDEMDITSAETKATYREVQQYVLQTTGLMVSNLNIAQIKDKCGFDKRENYNKPRTANSRQPKCTPEKEKAIMDAFRHFGMI